MSKYKREVKKINEIVKLYCFLGYVSKKEYKAFLKNFLKLNKK